MIRTSFVLRRAGQSLVVISLTYVFVFYTLFLLPGDPIKSRIENPQNPIPADQAATILAYYNLDRGAAEQFLLSVTRLLHGDLGYSLGTGRPVADLIKDGAAETVTLAVLSLVFALGFALTIATVAILAPWRWARTVAGKLPVVSLATPGFLVGLILLQVFAYQLGWVSSIRDEGIKSLVLPALMLAVGVSAPIAQVLIHGLRHAYAEPFVTVLRAKGVPESRIFGAHVLKNASIPALTLFGLTVGELLAGSVIAETVFNRSGLGFVTEQAVRAQDGPVVQAIVMLVAVVFTAVNLATDLLYPLIDKRIATTGSIVASTATAVDPISVNPPAATTGDPRQAVLQP